MKGQLHTQATQRKFALKEILFEHFGGGGGAGGCGGGLGPPLQPPLLSCEAELSGRRGLREKRRVLMEWG